MKIFDTVISPIFTYGSEVWGVDHDGKLENDPIEFVQAKFIRWLLGVNKFCTSDACRSEVGRFPMRTKTKCRSINQLYLNTVNGSASWFSDMSCDNYKL